MPGLIVSGLLGGLIFGVILVWQGAGAAGLVLLFALVGFLIGLALWLGWRLSTGQVDLQTLRALVDVVFLNRNR